MSQTLQKQKQNQNQNQKDKEKQSRDRDDVPRCSSSLLEQLVGKLKEALMAEGVEELITFGEASAIADTVRLVQGEEFALHYALHAIRARIARLARRRGNHVPGRTAARVILPVRVDYPSSIIGCEQAQLALSDALSMQRLLPANILQGVRRPPRACLPVRLVVERRCLLRMPAAEEPCRCRGSPIRHLSKWTGQSEKALRSILSRLGIPFRRPDSDLFRRARLPLA